MVLLGTSSEMETTQHKSAYLTRRNCDKHVHNLKQNKKKFMDLNIKKKPKKNPFDY